MAIVARSILSARNCKAVLFIVQAEDEVQNPWHTLRREKERAHVGKELLRWPNMNKTGSARFGSVSTGGHRARFGSHGSVCIHGSVRTVRFAFAGRFARFGLHSRAGSHGSVCMQRVGSHGSVCMQRVRKTRTFKNSRHPKKLTAHSKLY